MGMRRYRTLYYPIWVLTICIIFPSLLTAAIPAAERAALIALYNSTDGDNWTNNSGWKTPPLHTDGFAMPGTENGWEGITVLENYVTEISLIKNNLIGVLPSELGNCTNLLKLDLDANLLSGVIPSELGNCTNLEKLELQANELTGHIPAELGNCSKLKSLLFTANQLTGSIPAELGNCLNMEELVLAVNQLTGTIPAELGNCTKLIDLNLVFNQLTGSIPVELGNCSNLIVLDLSYNQLSGSIPAEIGNCSNLRSLYLNANKLNGIIADALINLTILESDRLDLRWNALYTDNDALRTFLNSKQTCGDWESSQTIAPTGLAVTGMTISSVTLSWNQVDNITLAGEYQVCYSRAGAGWVVYDNTTDKLTTSMLVSGLDAGVHYDFAVQTKSEPHTNNNNTVISDKSDPPLPVEIDPSLPVQLSAFTAEFLDNCIRLEWTTESEVNNLGFVLERTNVEPTTSASATADWQIVASYQTRAELRGQGSTPKATTYTFIDDRIDAGKSYQYRLFNVDLDGDRHLCDIVAITTPDLAEKTRLEMAYPNPFNPQTRITYHLAEPGRVLVDVFDILGRKIKSLVNRQQSAGSYDLTWYGRDDSNKQTGTGTYIIRMRTDDFVQMQKVLLIR